jgi:hypothetical protein
VTGSSLTKQLFAELRTILDLGVFTIHTMNEATTHIATVFQGLRKHPNDDSFVPVNIGTHHELIVRRFKQAAQPSPATNVPRTIFDDNRR